MSSKEKEVSEEEMNSDMHTSSDSDVSSDEDASRIHGANERLLLTSFHYGCEFLYRTVEELAAVKVEELPEEEEEPEVVDDEDESAAVDTPAIEGPAASSTSVRK